MNANILIFQFKCSSLLFQFKCFSFNGSVYSVACGPFLRGGELYVKPLPHSTVAAEQTSPSCEVLMASKSQAARQHVNYPCQSPECGANFNRFVKFKQIKTTKQNTQRKKERYNLLLSFQTAFKKLAST